MANPAAPMVLAMYIGKKISIKPSSLRQDALASLVDLNSRAYASGQLVSGNTSEV